MRHATRETIEADPGHQRADDDEGISFDDDAVLEILEPGLDHQFRDDVIIGIRNALLIGGLIWIAVLTIVAVFR